MNCPHLTVFFVATVRATLVAHATLASVACATKVALTTYQALISGYHTVLIFLFTAQTYKFFRDFLEKIKNYNKKAAMSVTTLRLFTFLLTYPTRSQS